MTKHKVGTQEEWRAARNAARARAGAGHLDEELAKQRQELPWVRVAGRNSHFPLRRHDEY